MPAPISARQRFGLASRPLSSYYPEIPGTAQIQDNILRTNPLMVPYSVYDPGAIDNARQLGEAKGFVDNMDPSDPEAITGLQRLVGKGLVKPQQASAIFAINDRIQREKDRQEAMNFRKQMAEQKAQMPNKDLMKNYQSYIQDVGDEEKRSAFKKNAGREIETDEDWNRAWHMIKDPRKNKLLADIESLAASGGHVPDSLLQLHQELRGQAPAPVLQSTEQPAAVAPQSQQGPIKPNAMHIWQLKQDPSLAPQFDQKFGQGAAASVLGQ